MEAIISIVGALASKAVEYTVGPAARQLSYLFKPRSKFLNLHSKVRDLEEATQRLQQSVEAATRNGEVIFDDVQRWLTEVNEKISEQAATQLLEDEEKATKRCFMGFCPDFRSRYHLSKKADREANAIAQLLTKKDAFNKVGHLPAVQAMDIIRPVKEYEAFGSRNSAFDGVMAALEDDAVSIIGVYGMGGVGKTTLVKDVARQTKKKLSFDEVVFVAVTQTTNKANIQNEIANQLGLELCKDPSEHVRAARLCDRLKKAKKVLVILDDIWEKQEVDTLGIPSADQHKGCKILMTSRKLVVLKSMNSQQNFTIDLLNEEEAWNLFKNVAGHFVERSDLQSTARKVAQKCAGLPLAITTVAKALKYKDNLYEWHDALERLKPSENNFQGIQDEAYSAIELSYTYLKSEELKSTFLLCSVMGHDAAIQDLLKHCRGLRLFQGLDTMEKVRNRVLTLVSELKDSSLLLAGSTPELFDMHDVVCDVAISIASRDRGWLALRKEDVFEGSSIEDKMRNSQLVSLKYAKVSQLLDELECPNLTFFSTHGTVEVPDNFFKRMQTLKVLEFASPGFTSLPSSIGSLKSLCALHLIDCNLKNIIILGGLEKLEFLDLRRSVMKILPEEIGQITGLKLLDLSKCFYLEVISSNVLSKLSKLEELYLYDSFDKWEVEGSENPRSNASLVELQHLSCLTTLEIHIPDAEAIPKDNLFWEKMKRFKISIGHQKWYSYFNSEMETSRMLKLNINKSIHLVDRIKPLFRKIQSLYLDGMEDVGEMQMLYHPNVESFEHLKLIKVKKCNMLQNLFSSSIVKRLCQLEILEVSNCKNIIGLIVEKEEIDEDDKLEFNKLRILKLNHLNRFNGLWYSKNTFQSPACLFDKKVSCPALEVLQLYGCDKLKYVFTSSMVESFVHLKTLVVSECGEMEGVIEVTLDVGKGRVTSPHCLIDEKISCSVLEKLKLNGCHKLKYVFPSSMVKSFVHLKTLEVSDCDKMEGIIEGTLLAEEGTSSSTRLFPKLDSLSLSNLPKLKRFGFIINAIEFLSLKSLMIRGCHALNTFTFDDGKSTVTPPHYLFDEKVILPVLKELIIEDMDNLERLWADQLIEHSFSKLNYISLSGCPKLLNVFPLSMLIKRQKLPRLKILGCESVEEIIYEGGGSSSSSNGMPSLSPQFIQSKVILFKFPNLTSLVLWNLSNLKSIINNKMHTTIWPSLKSMTMDGCHAVEILFADFQEISSQQPLFWVNEVSFPILEELKVIKCRKLKHVFTSSVIKRFVQLKTLEVSECDEMEEVIQENLAAKEEEEGNKGSTRVFPKLDTLNLSGLPQLRRFCCGSNPIEFSSLRSLKIWACPDLNTFNFDDGKSTVTPTHYFFNEKVILPMLEEMSIAAMGSLEMLWTDQLVEQSFFKLTSIYLINCPKLLNVFPSSMLPRLRRLDKLSIWSCKSLKEIISEEGNNSGIASVSPQFIQSNVISFEFPNLTSFSLWNLPNLKSIHHNEMLTINWPSLKEMRVDECDKVEILFANSQETSSQQPLFWVNESTLPKLHQLFLGWNAGIKDIIWHCQGQQQQQHFVSQYFVNLKVVTLYEYPEQVTVLPSYLLSLSNFQTLEISQCSFKEMIFQSEEGGEEKPASLLLSHIIELRLDGLQELMHLWKENEGFPNLRILHVLDCPRLKVNLVPSSVSFQNLVTLKVERCNGIIKLISHPTAKSLVQLKEMNIENCENIEEIVQGGDDDDEDGISFPQLNSLELVDLPKLESFCSSDKYTFEFPSLEFLLLKDCPKMKNFSEGHSNTPMLHKVQLYYKWRKAGERWEGNLNSTIQKLFRKKNLKKEVESYVKDQDNSPTSKEDQSKPSTSNTQVFSV